MCPLWDTQKMNKYVIISWEHSKVWYLIRNPRYGCASCSNCALLLSKSWAVCCNCHRSSFVNFHSISAFLTCNSAKNIWKSQPDFLEVLSLSWNTVSKARLGAAVVKASQLPEMLPWLHNTQGVRGMETRNWFQSKIVPNNRKLKNRRIFKKQQLKNVLVCSFLFDSLLINLLLIFTSVYIQ